MCVLTQKVQRSGDICFWSASWYFSRILEGLISGWVKACFSVLISVVKMLLNHGGSAGTASLSSSTLELTVFLDFNLAKSVCLTFFPGQPTQIIEVPFLISRNDSKHETRWSRHCSRNLASSRSACPSNDRISPSRYSNVMGLSRVRRRAESISDVSPLLLAMAYARKTSTMRGGLHATSARIED